MLPPASYRTYANDNDVCTAAHFPSDRLGPWLSAVIDACLDGVLVVDTAFQIVLANAEVGSLFVESPQQLLGRSLDALLSKRERAAHRATLRALAGSRPVGRRPRIHTTLQYLRTNGEEFYCETLITCVTLRGAVFFSLILRTLRIPFRSPARQYVATTEPRRCATSSHHTHEVEKRRFSRVLYDDLGQSLGVLKLDMDGLQQSLIAPPLATATRIASMQSTLDGAISRVKSIASALRPPLLDDFGLIPALLWVTSDFQKKSGIRCVFKKDNVSIDIDEHIESAIFRVVQESLANIERHAQATDVQIFLWQNDRSVDVLVHDDGIGILRDAPRKPGCHGLIAMQDRIATLDGTITFNNIEPHGLAIHVSIPVVAD